MKARVMAYWKMEMETAQSLSKETMSFEMPLSVSRHRSQRMSGRHLSSQTLSVLDIHTSKPMSEDVCKQLVKWCVRCIVECESYRGVNSVSHRCWRLNQRNPLQDLHKRWAVLWALTPARFHERNEVVRDVLVRNHRPQILPRVSCGGL